MTIQTYDQIYVKISDLTFDKENPNQLSKDQIEGIKKSFTKFGNVDPILIDQNNLIVHGNHRALVYKEMGMPEIPCYRREFKDDNERRLCSQTMNKLHGRYENTLDGNQLTRIFQSGSLNELGELIAKNNYELGDIIQKYSEIADKQLLDALMGGDSSLRGTGSLVKRFGVPPFSVLDSTSKIWQDRKNLWLNWGLSSEKGREHIRYYNLRISPNLPTISVFDPVLAEIAYRWFTPKPNSKVLDPFCGGSVRGIVASFLGHEYHGVDLRQEQIDANEKQWEKLKERMPTDNEKTIYKPNWYVGDSRNIDDVIGEKEDKFDMLLTSPPYFQQEHYSNLEEDMNNMDLLHFIETYKTIIQKCSTMLKPEGSFVVWNTSNTRDAKTGKITNIIHIINEEFQKYGFFLLNDLMLLRTPMGLQAMAPRHFMNKRYCGNRHESVLVFFRGEDKQTIPKLDTEIVDIPEYEFENDDEYENESEEEEDKDEDEETI